MHLTGWDVVLWIHLLAMAAFVGGQLMLGIAVAPVYVRQGGKDSPAQEWMIPIARGYGWISLAAIVILLITGSAMASHFHLWDTTSMQVKLGLVTAAVVLTAVHVFVKGSNRLLQGLILLVSLAIVLVATTL